MTDEGPWQRYDRDKLPKGWAYPLGRDEVSAALVAAGVSLGSLSFRRTDQIRSPDSYVLHAYWPSDSRAKYFGSRDPDISPLMLSVSAFPRNCVTTSAGNSGMSGWNGLSPGHNRRRIEATSGRRQTTTGTSSISPTAG